MGEYQDILYYDGHCPICRREMAQLKAIKDDNLVLLNIHEQVLAEEVKAVLLSQLHVLTYDKQLLMGFKANIRAWQHTPYALWVKPFDYPPLSWIGRLAYFCWLRYYHWNKRRCSSVCDV